MQQFYILKLIKYIFIFILSFPMYAVTYYVTESGAGSRNATSWTNALAGNNLQALINYASPGDEIWVACGTYKPTTGTDRNLSFSMKNGVAIYGGFKGTETALTERAITCGPCSILSGEIGVSGIADNSFKVVFNQGLNATAILDGFVIRDGNDDRTPTNSGNGLGGGLCNNGYNQGNCSPSVRNCLFTNNRASWGGGAFNNGYNGGVASPNYTNCVFFQNHAYIEAGGMDSYGVRGTVAPVLTNCIFYGNTSATNVGAMYVWGGSGGEARPKLTNCIFANNTALNGYGGAFISDNSDETGGTSSGISVVTLQNCIVWNNTAIGTGPQFYRKGTGSQVVALNSTINLTGQTGSNSIDASSSEVLNSDPLFQNGSNPMGVDNCWFTSDDGLQLQSNSTSLNSGLNVNAPLFDILGNPRSTAQQVHRGAYESQSGLEVIKIVKNFENIKFYPNPFESVLNIKAINLEVNEIKVVDVLGKDITSNIKKSKLDDQSLQMDFEQLASGIYFVKVGTNFLKVLKR